jgi:insulysin
MVNIIKSASDKREYDYLKLDNELEILLISDPNTDTSSCALSVGVGSMDEQDIAGLAHFLEHMLFLGSKKYPIENYYDNFLSKNGGMGNAYTAVDHTCFFNSVVPEALTELLDIFAQFFIDPSFNEDAVLREINAVDSEHQKNIGNDMWRNEEILKLSFDKTHPHSRFSTGNLETLKIDNIHKFVKDFYNEHYSANIMKCVILGSEDIVTLKKNVSQIFSKIPNKNVKIDRNYGKLIDSKKYVQIIPIKSENILSINWNVPVIDQKYYHNFITIIDYIFTSESKSSLYDILRKKKLVREFGLHEEKIGDYYLYKLIIGLTDEGIKYQKTICDTVYEYIEKIINYVSSGKIDETINELRIIFEDRFKYLEIGDYMDYTAHIASIMSTTNIPIEKILSHGYEMPDANDETKKILLKMLSHLNSENSIVVSVSSNYERYSDIFITDKWYSAKYLIHDDFNLIKDKKKINISDSLTLPNKNPYLTTNKEIIKNNEMLNPMCEEINKGFDFWWKYDVSFDVPYVYVSVDIKFKDIRSDIHNYLYLSLYNNCLKYKLTDYLFETGVAGYDITFVSTNDGIHVSFYGYPDKMPIILTKLFDNYLNFKKTIIEKDDFNYIRFLIKESLENYFLEAPYLTVGTILREECENNYYSPEKYLKIIDNLKYEDMFDCVERLFNNKNIKCLAEGNLDIKYVDNIKELLTNKLNNGLFELSYDDEKLIKQLKNKEKIIEKNIINNEEMNSLCVSYYQLEYIRVGYTNDWAQKICVMQLMSDIISKDYYDKLRTKQQLGYVVNGNLSTIGSDIFPMHYYRFLVQSNHKDPKYIHKKTQEYVTTGLTKILNMKDKEFRTYVNSKISQLEKPFQNSLEKIGYDYDSIMYTENAFDRKEILIKTYKEVTQKDIIDFFNEYFVKNPHIVTIYMHKNMK